MANLMLSAMGAFAEFERALSASASVRQWRSPNSAALTLAQELAHPFSLTFALYEAALLHQVRREWPQTLDLAGSAMRV
jgi:hypothetical protein